GAADVRVAAIGYRRAERLGVGIFVLIAAMALRDAKVGVDRAQDRGDGNRQLPLVAVLAMMRRGDVGSAEVVHILRHAEVVVRSAACEADLQPRRNGEARAA